MPEPNPIISSLTGLLPSDVKQIVAQLARIETKLDRLLAERTQPERIVRHADGSVTVRMETAKG